MGGPGCELQGSSWPSHVERDSGGSGLSDLPFPLYWAGNSGPSPEVLEQVTMLEKLVLQPQ